MNTFPQENKVILRARRKKVGEKEHVKRARKKG